MPIACKKLWDSLGANSLGPIEKQLISKVADWGQLEPGTKVSKGEILFPRLEEVAN
jgi:methionyl-tRNA synthetase